MAVPATFVDETLVAVPVGALAGIIHAALLAGAALDPVVKLKFALERRGQVLCDDAATAFATRIATMVATRYPSATDPDAPTPQTVAKRTRDPVEWLMRNLTPAEAHAANTIRDCREALARGLEVSAQQISLARVDGGAAYRDPVDRLTSRMAKLISHVYLPWAKATGEAGETRGGRPTHTILVGSRRLPLAPFDLVGKVLIDRIPLRTLEHHYGVRSGALSGPFRAALGRFDEIYGAAMAAGVLGKA